MARSFATLLGLGAALLPVAASAAPSMCDIGVYLADPDPAGTNLRAAPSREARVVARLPHSRRDGDDDYAPELRITGFDKGWAQVSRAVFEDYGGAGQRVLFRGAGWVWGGLLSTTLNRPHLRSRPTANAPVVARLMGENWGPDSVQVLAIEDCIGAFARIRGKLPDGKPVSGWTDGLCSNQVTTCP